jgi:hypothetical protein
MPPASAQEPTPAAPAAPAQPREPAEVAKPGAKAKGATFEINIDTKAGADSAKATAKEDNTAPEGKVGAAREHAITVSKDGKTVTVTGIPDDSQFDALGEKVQFQPTPTMIVAIVAVVFLSPVLAIALIVGYRMRRARMQNETVLKLAERGIMPTAETLAAVVGNRSAAAWAEGGVDIRKRAAWSDLRKGVVMTAIGIAVTIPAVLDEHAPGILGLALLFVGLGYIGLWWFEQRQLAMSGDPQPRPPAGPGDTGSSA